MTAYFPVVATARDAVPAATPAATGNGDETILIVEDEPAIRALMQRTLERFGYTVLIARSAADAMAIAESSSCDIHLLLSDVIMPEVCGPELAQRILRLRPDLRVLYVSGFPRRAGATPGVMSSRTAFLSKPFSSRALAVKVRECLDSRF